MHTSRGNSPRHAQLVTAERRKHELLQLRHQHKQDFLHVPATPVGGDPYACTGYTSIIYAFAVQVSTVSTSDLLTVLQQQASVTQSTGVSAYTISL